MNDAGARPDDASRAEERPALGAPGPQVTNPYRRFVPYLVGIAVLALVGAWLLVARSEQPSPVAGTAAVGDRPFGDGGVLPPGADEAVFSPDGTRLAVIDEGRVRLAVNGELVDVTDPGGRVVDVAWMPGSNGLLVAEGPSSTGILPVVAPDGRSLGVVRPAPPLQPGGGFGMSVDPDGRRAVVVSVERPALEDEGRYLAAVDLETGATRRLTKTTANPRTPRHVSSGRVALSVDGRNGPEVVVLDVASGVAAKVADGELVGVAGGRPVVVDPDGRTVRLLRAGDVGDEVLARLDGGVRPVAVHPTGRALVVLERIEAGADTTVRLRLVRTDRTGPPTAPAG